MPSARYPWSPFGPEVAEWEHHHGRLGGESRGSGGKAAPVSARSQPTGGATEREGERSASSGARERELGRGAARAPGRGGPRRDLRAAAGSKVSTGAFQR